MAPATQLWPSWTTRALLFTAVWLIVAGPEPGSLLIGVPAIAVATWASLRIGSSSVLRLSLPGMFRFLGFFLRESLRGGLDVASRTLRPRLDIRPGFVDYECRLPSGRARLLFASCVSLLPGTLTAEMDGRRLTVHLLDTAAPIVDELNALEAAIAQLFSLPPEPSHA